MVRALFPLWRSLRRALCAVVAVPSSQKAASIVIISELLIYQLNTSQYLPGKRKQIVELPSMPINWFMFLAGLVQIFASTILRYAVPSMSTEDVKAGRSEDGDSLFPSSLESTSPTAHHNPNFRLLALATSGTLLQSILVNYLPSTFNVSDSRILYICASLQPVITLAMLQCLQYLSDTQAYSITNLLLLTSGIFIYQLGFPALRATNVTFLFCLMCLCSLQTILMQLFFKANIASIHLQNVIAGCLQSLIFGFLALSDGTGKSFPMQSIPNAGTVVMQYVFLHALVSAASGCLLKYGDAVTLSVTRTSVVPLVLTSTAVSQGHVQPITTYYAIAMIAISIISFFRGRMASALSFTAESHHLSTLKTKPSAPWQLPLFTGLILILTMFTARSVRLSDRHFRPSPLLASPFVLLPSDIFSIPPGELVPRICDRRQLISHQLFSHWHSENHNDSVADFYKDAFQDVLLIVFFSHARYDVNLDLYREAYTPYFPNMVFVGPGSRADAGFNHSYDIILDSYKSDENLNDPSWYRMSGRMAHHMLYTVLDQHVAREDCYNGYLWAPFDTLLNVPRLAQFSQDKIWYHSPFAQYVDNIALVNTSKHPPPARISPDPYGNVTEVWRGWGKDWWWGDPHVGLGECMPAFHRVPQVLRDRLAGMTGNKTRLIGGSADTLYFPDGILDELKQILALFLETDCFLEIALPTALHLALPRDQSILFVDHWWIWRAPFNGSYVRRQWKSDYEVDTFHTFHWGQRDNGTFRAREGIVEDVAHIQLESHIRQTTGIPNHIHVREVPEQQNR